MIRLVWPEAMGMATTPQLWKSLHEFLQRTHSTVHLAEVNDDLVGFSIRFRDSRFWTASPDLWPFIRRETFHRTSQFPFASCRTANVPGPASHGPEELSTSNTCMFRTGIHSFCFLQGRRLHHAGTDVPATPRNLHRKPDQSCPK